MVEACDLDAQNSEIYSIDDHKRFLMTQMFEDREKTGDTVLIVYEDEQK